MQIIEIENPSEFDSVFSKHVSSVGKGHLFVYFSGSVDSATGKSWCSDCVQAETLVHHIFKQIGSGIVLKCWVNKADYKESPYRRNPKIQLKAIPTLIHWGKTGPKERLVEEECYNQQMVEDFIETIQPQKQ